MKTALIYPPTADPTAPYLALPALAGFLRAYGEEIVLIDANVEACHALLQPAFLESCRKRIDARFSKLRRKAHLSHAEKLVYLDIAFTKNSIILKPAAITDALAILTDHSGFRFFDPVQYESAVTTISGAFQNISAAYAPMTLDFTQYRTPFSLLSLEEIERDARPERNPFHTYFEQELIPRLEQSGVELVGLSVVFPGQIQSAYALALRLRRQLPDVYVTVGGPAITRILLRLKGEYLRKALGPFHSAVLFEGEQALLDLIRAVARGEKPTGLIHGNSATNLADLPAPDFHGLPLDRYLSPARVLPYDPSRGCYWGRCAFCHYGLTAQGTAGYRERPVAQIADHLQQMQQQWGNHVFYFSHDTLSPKLAQRIARELIARKITCRWGSDMRPEKSLTPDLCGTLAAGGMLSAAVGLESVAPRVLQMINKGLSIPEMESAIQNLAQAGIAVEAMCFTGFPTETFSEALTTLRFLEQHHPHLALFICGQFALVSGARIAQHPQEYGIQEIWQVQGDELLQQLFYEEKISALSDAEYRKIETALDRLAQGWWLHRYPWAGSLSTAHTLLWYDKFGPDIFKHIAANRPVLPQSTRRPTAIRIPSPILAAREREAMVWETLVYKKRKVSREEYRKLAGAMRV